MKTRLILFVFVLGLTGCFAAGPAQTEQIKPSTQSQPSPGRNNAELHNMNAAPETAEPKDGQNSGPKTVRDFFMLLPEKYFVLEGCERKKDKGCKKAKLEYLKSLAEIEDTANGYLKGGCDGGQSCIEMALFKRPDGTYLIGVATWGEMLYDHFFLDYKDGVWTDVSSKVMPEFSKKNIYELPRYGTTVKVFAKKIIEQGDGWEASEKGAKLYDMEWKDGKFTKK